VFPLRVEAIIEEAIDNGELDDLPGQGQPITGAGVRDDPMWWVRAWVERQRQPGED
jgi:hypothetical protein